MHGQFTLAVAPTSLRSVLLQLKKKHTVFAQNTYRLKLFNRKIDKIITSLLVNAHVLRIF